MPLRAGFPAFQVGVGILRFLAAIRLAWAAFSLPGSRIRTVGVLGAVAVLGAGFNGASFPDFNADFRSMIMASLFAIVLLCFSWTLFRVSSAAPQSPPSPS